MHWQQGANVLYLNPGSVHKVPAKLQDKKYVDPKGSLCAISMRSVIMQLRACIPKHKLKMLNDDNASTDAQISARFTGEDGDKKPPMNWEKRTCDKRPTVYHAQPHTATSLKGITEPKLVFLVRSIMDGVIKVVKRQVCTQQVSDFVHMCVSSCAFLRRG